MTDHNGDNGTPQFYYLCFRVPHKRNSKERDNRRIIVVPHKPDPSGCVHECAEFPRF